MSSSDTKVFKKISSYYDQLVNQYGHSPRACDYGNPLSQQTKFRTLSEVMDLTGKTILDVGCGMGDYADYLTGRFRDFTYSGIDISPKMVETARQAHPSLDIQMGNIIKDAMGRFDVITANGIFYLLGPGAPTLMKEMVARMYALSIRAVAFNSLSSWAHDKEEGEFYADPLETTEFCRQLTPWVVLRHDYHPRDFSVYLYREQNK